MLVLIDAVGDLWRGTRPPCRRRVGQADRAHVPHAAAADSRRAEHTKWQGRPITGTVVRADAVVPLAPIVTPRDRRDAAIGGHLVTVRKRVVRGFENVKESMPGINPHQHTSERTRRVLGVDSGSWNDSLGIVHGKLLHVNAAVYSWL